MEYTAFLSIFLVGLAYGMTACMLSCMPFLSPILVSNSNSFKESMRVMVPFSLGRIFSYTIIAIAATGSAVAVKAFINNNGLFNLLLGSVALLMGTYMLHNAYNKEKRSCGIHKPVEKRANIGSFGLFSIGVSVSVNLCPPIVTLVTVAGSSASYYNSMVLGLLFGLGATLFTFLFYGFFMSTLIRGILEQFSTQKKAVEIAASLLLIGVGLLTAAGKLTL